MAAPIRRCPTCGFPMDGNDQPCREGYCALAKLHPHLTEHYGANIESIARGCAEYVARGQIQNDPVRLAEYNEFARSVGLEEAQLGGEDDVQLYIETRWKDYARDIRDNKSVDPSASIDDILATLLEGMLSRCAS